MKFALVSTGQFAQDKDLLREAKKKNHSLEIIQINNLPLPPPADFFSNYNLIYWRVGNVKIRQIFSCFVSEKKIPFINSGYFKFPLLGEKSFQLYQAEKLGIPIPKSILQVAKNYDFSFLEKKLGSPLIIKKNIGARGKTVWLIKKESELKEIIKKYSLKEFIAQEFIPNNGDIRVIVVGKKPIGLFKRIPKKGDFRANISQGGHGQLINNRSKIEILYSLAKKISRHLCLEIAGVDFIENQGKFYFIETNSIVQWQGFQKTTGINVAEKVIKYFEKKALL